MKTSLKAFIFAALLAVVGISNSFGAYNVYVKAIGQGKTKIVQVKCPDGSCATTVDGLTPGKYTFTLCDANGTAMKVKERANSVKCTVSFTYTCVQTAREASTGMASGKRMHKPFTVTAEVSRTGEIILSGDVDGDSFTFQKIEWTWSDGSKSAMDDWSTSTN